MAIEAVNPTTGENIKVYKEISSEEVKGIIEKSNESFQSWRKKKL